MSTIELVYDPIKQVKTITKTKNGCTTTETQTEYLIPYDCKQGDKLILFLKDAAKAANAGGVIVGDVITRTYENGQYKYFVQYADSDLGAGVVKNSLTQCDILKVCCYDCIAEYNDLTALTSIDAGCGIVVNNDGEFEANTSGVWGEGNLVFANGDAPFTAGGEIYCGDDGELRGLPPYEIFNAREFEVPAPAALPVAVSVVLTNASVSRKKRFFIDATIQITGTTSGADNAPIISAGIDLAGDEILAPSTVGVMTWASGTVISTTFPGLLKYGYEDGNEIELEPGETKTLVVTWDDNTTVGTPGVTYTLIVAAVNVLGIDL